MNELGVSISCKPISVSFRNLSYSVKCFSGSGRADSKCILDRVNGFAQPRALTALMGASGAGKTTLLSLLAGRKYQGKIEGEILLNGMPIAEATPTTKSMAMLRACVGYCEQTELLSEMSTCREVIAFSARLRSPHAGNASALDLMVSS